LGKIKDSRALEPLGRALEDEDEGVRLSAAEALAEMGDVRAVEPLIGALKHENWYVRRNATGLLINIGSGLKGQAFLQFCSDVAEMVSRDEVSALLAHRVLAAVYERRGEKVKAQAEWAKTGFIPEPSWLVIGPFETTHDRTGPPEREIDLCGTYPGEGKEVSWTVAQDGIIDGYVDFRQIFSLERAAAGYALTYVNSPDERQAELIVECDFDVKVWFNGSEVLNKRSVDLERHVLPVVLQAGRNEILVKVCGGWGASGFYLRITDTEGKPFEDLEYVRADALLDINQ